MGFLLELNWLAIGQIILIDILLGGDNAIVIALACRDLPPKLRLQGILWGTAGAVVLRIALIASAVTLLQVPYLKLVGGVLLFWIGVKLLSDHEDTHGHVQASKRLLSAIKTIIVADLVMSIDNVVAVASAAERAGGRYQLALVVFGIAVSIPIIVWGSTLVLKLMERFPVIITLGAALLGYLAGAMVLGDAALVPWIKAYLPQHEIAIPPFGVELSLPGLAAAVAVVVIGRWLMKKQTGEKR